MDTNVKGVFFSMKYEIPAILRSGGGAIVNNASIVGLRAIVGGAPIYTASKFGVVGLTRSVALEFANKGVRVNAVCPAIIETDMAASLLEKKELRNDLLAKHPIGRFGNQRKLPPLYSISGLREPLSLPELHCR